MPKKLGRAFLNHTRGKFAHTFYHTHVIFFPGRPATVKQKPSKETNIDFEMINDVTANLENIANDLEDFKAFITNEIHLLKTQMPPKEKDCYRINIELKLEVENMKLDIINKQKIIDISIQDKKELTLALSKKHESECCKCENQWLDIEKGQ